MFDQSAEQPASDPSAPLGMREMPPQPARPVMPAYTLPSATAATAPVGSGARVEERSSPGADDSVIAQDDHVEGTFTSRGTVVVIGSLKGRIEALRVRIEPGASVDADVIVDEAIVAGEFMGNLTCRERLEARPTGRINGKVETFKLMLHEGASVEGEMHMLAERPRDAAETIRGSAPLRGEAPEAKPPARAATPSGAASESQPSAATPVPAATRPAPVVAPASSARSRPAPAQPVAAAPAQPVAPAPAQPVAPAPTQPVAPAPTAAPAPRPAPSPSQLPSVEAILATRSTAAQTLRIDGLRVAPRTTSSAQRPSGSANSSAAVSNGPRTRNGSSSAF